MIFSTLCFTPVLVTSIPALEDHPMESTYHPSYFRKPISEEEIADLQVRLIYVTHPILVRRLAFIRNSTPVDNQLCHVPTPLTLAFRSKIDCWFICHKCIFGMIKKEDNRVQPLEPWHKLKLFNAQEIGLGKIKTRS